MLKLPLDYPEEKKTRENYFQLFNCTHKQTGNAENKHGDCFLSTRINIEIESYLNNC